MSDTPICTSVYLFVADQIWNEDERQEAYLAILEAKPQTYAEAVAAVSKAHHKAEWDRRQYRKRNDQLDFDPVATQQDSGEGTMCAALDRLSGPDQELIEAHVIDGKPLRELALAAGVSKDTIAKRYAIAADKLRAIVEKR